MSLFGMALAGGGAAAADLANKYLDAQFANQRAQVLADIQRNSAIKMDEYTNSPDRRAGLRTQENLDTGAKSAQARADALLLANDTRLIDAGASAENRKSDATRASRAADSLAMDNTKLHDVAPGNKMMRGEGVNEHPTAADLTYKALLEDIKNKHGTERDRATEEAAKGLRERLGKLDDRITTGLESGSLTATPAKVETGIFGGVKEQKPNPAYDNYQLLLREKRKLEMQQQQLMQEWRGTAAPGASPTSANSGPDPLGIRAGANLQAGPAEAGMRKVVQSSAADVAYNNAIEYSPENRAALVKAIESAKLPEQKQVLQQELAALDSKAYGAAAPPGGLIAASAAPAASKKAEEPPAQPTTTARQALSEDAARKPGEPRARVAAAQAQQEQAKEAIRVGFDRDMDTMGVVEFARKYDAQRGVLTDKQLATLAKIMRKL